MPFTAAQWVRHQKGLSYDGRCVCIRCGIELPYTIPIQQTVCTKEDRIYLNDISEAMDCHAV